MTISYSGLNSLVKGDYVVFNDPNRDYMELGRIAENNIEKQYMRVCFHGGCTASKVDYSLLHNISINGILSSDLGFHRFDYCPDYGSCPMPYDGCKPPQSGVE